MYINSENAKYVIKVLKEKGIIDAEKIERAKRDPAISKGYLNIIDVLIKMNYITEVAVLTILADLYGMEMIDLQTIQISQEVINSVPTEYVKQYRIIPIEKTEDTIKIAMNNPADVDTVDSLRYVLKINVEAVIAPQQQIDNLIDYYYKGLHEDVDSIISDIKNAEVSDFVEISTLENIKESEKDAPIIKLVAMIIGEAFFKKASDIHLEPMQNKFRIRYRIDGILVEEASPPKYLQANIISRIKIMANLDISEKRVPQDGRIQVRIKDKLIDLRISSIPSSHGESIVMRILDKTNVLLDVSTLGFLSTDIEIIKQIIAMPDGMFLVTGPTGSGKTTSLYSFLSTVNTLSKKIITVEDPVEYNLEGINQVQANSRIGMTFAAVLRAMMRQAPNIVMVGEIRDSETAEIAINAALTGHLVFSTLHTNDAPGAITRLIDIGVKPFLVASAVKAVMAQRLVRKVCPSCAMPYSPTEEEREYLKVNEKYFDNANLLKGKGCSECLNGYSGRMGIYEIFLVTEEIQDLIFKNASVHQIRAVARKNGMKTLREDGLSKAMAGMTTIEEVIKITLGDETNTD